MVELSIRFVSIEPRAVSGFGSFPGIAAPFS